MNIITINDKLDTIKNESARLGIDVVIDGDALYNICFKNECDMNLYQLCGTVKPNNFIRFAVV